MTTKPMTPSAANRLREAARAARESERAALRARAKLRRELKQANARGHSVRTLAAEAGLSVTATQRLLKGGAL